MSNTYIIFTTDIHPIGGMQLYTAGKADFLEKKGWKVKILFDGRRDGNCKIESLNKYLPGGFSFISSDPFIISTGLRQRAINQLVDYIGNVNEEDLVYVESQSDFTSLWAEMIAKYYKGKHICFNCNEIFRGPNKIYDKYIEFFKYKYDRKELYALHNDSFSLLFDSFYNVKNSFDLVFDAVEPNPVQDIYSEYVDSLKQDRINISYIGRSSKTYVTNIINGVARFAKNNDQLNIRFIMIGEANDKKDYINNMFKDVNNVVIDLPGDLVPIPRSLFKKIDVVLAGAVCAELSTCEGVQTIVADCNTNKSCGVLGYTVDNSMYSNSNEQNEFDVTLEEVLIEKRYKNKVNTFPCNKNSDHIYESHLNKYIIKNDLSYYFKDDFVNIYSLKKHLISNAKVLFPKLYFMFIRN